MKLMGKMALVTGAARGSAAAARSSWPARAPTSSVNDRERRPRAWPVVAEIEAMGRRSVAGRRGRLRAAVVRKRGRAGERAHSGASTSSSATRRFSAAPNFLDYDPETFTRVIEGTLIGGFHMSQLVARHMVERGGGGKIVFISSCHVHTPYARSVAYNAAKGGLNHMALTIAGELHRAPDQRERHRARLDRHARRARSPSAHEAIARAGAALPWGRLGTPEDIGKAAAFLASDDADYITGAILPRRRRHLAPARARMSATQLPSNSFRWNVRALP